MWRGRKEAKGGHCLLAWPKVTCPKGLGGLGISDLRGLNCALRMWWLWLRKTEPTKPWVSFPFQTNDRVKAFFAMARITEIWDGSNTQFWKYRWLFGKRVEDFAPHIFAKVAKVPKRITNRRGVLEALTDTTGKTLNL
jgi:hypothetical protein